MRELTLGELELISGGSTTDDWGGGDIVVVADGGGDWGDWGDWGDDWYDGGDYGDGGGGGGSDGVGGPDQVPPEDCRDRNALSAQSDITADSNHHNKEHGSLIYRVNGEVHRSPVFEGQETSANGGYSFIDPQVVFDWMAANNISFSQVEGWVHNHDAYHYGTSQQEADINRYPSGNDWNFANYMVNHGAGGAGGANFALYVIDVDDDMREFNYGDRSTYTGLSNDQKERGSSLPSQLVSDGSTCG